MNKFIEAKDLAGSNANQDVSMSTSINNDIVKPQPLKVIYDALPEELKNNGRFCLWRYELKNDNWTKVPYQKNGYRTKVNDINTYSDFETIWNIYKLGKYDGVGIGNFNNISAIDIDHCIIDGIINEQAQKIINLFNSYTEISPSGKGVRIFFKNQIGANFDTYKYYTHNSNNGQDIEIYISGQTNKYLSYTGHSINNDIKNLILVTDETIQSFLNQYMIKPVNNKKNDNNIINNDSVKLSVSEIVDAIQKSENANLFNGDISKYNNDDSAGDLALCSSLCFWCNGDAALIDLVFRESALMRDKWNRKDYRDVTINKALSSWNGKSYQTKHNIKTSKSKTTKQQPETKNKYVLTDNKRVGKDDIKAYLDSINIQIKRNLITNKNDIFGFREQFGVSEDDEQTYLENEIHEFFCIKNNKSLSFEKISICINQIGEQNRYNPIIEILNNNTYQGESKLFELYEILNINVLNDENIMYQTFVKKWLIQCVAMLFNDIEQPIGNEIVLVLIGGEGTGKSTFFEKLSIDSNKYHWSGTINMTNKDNIIESTSRWISELAEIQSTFKYEQESLKDFITRKKDVYRTPYSKSDRIRPRHVSFGATLNPQNNNDMGFLKTESGGRRWATIQTNNIDKVRLNNWTKNDVIQLWEEIYRTFYLQGDTYRLTDEEKEFILNINDTKYIVKLLGEDELNEFLDWEKDETTWCHYGSCTLLENIKKKHIINNAITSRHIGKVLSKFEKIKHLKTRKVHGIVEYYLPPIK